MPYWRRWVGASFATGVAVVFCVAYVDRPLARVMASVEPLRHFLARAPVDIPLLIVLAVAAIIFALGRVCFGKPLARWMTAAVMAGVALVVSVVLTEYVLKSIFGRTVPSVYLDSGRYGFRWFHRGEDFGSFPSAHSDQAAAVLSVFWFFYPRWRWLYVIAFLVLLFLLMVGEFHYLSDVIAGAYVGTVAGAATISIWNAVAKRGRERTAAPRGDAKRPPPRGTAQANEPEAD